MMPSKIQFLTTSLFLTLIRHFTLSGCSGVLEQAGVTFHVKNKCTFPIWPATAPNSGHPVIAGGGFFLPSGETKRISAPPEWTGRLWARTGCRFSNSSSSYKPACRTGDCEGRLACEGATGLPPATLLQVALQKDMDTPNYYDVSLVEGYNLPISVATTPENPECSIDACRRSPNEQCPLEMQVVGTDGTVVGCKSACLAYFDNDKFCCRNDFGTPETCRPNRYSRMFKEACPSYFSYAFDTPSTLVNCFSTEYLVTFCPSRWATDSTL